MEQLLHYLMSTPAPPDNSTDLGRLALRLTYRASKSELQVRANSRSAAEGEFTVRAGASAAGREPARQPPDGDGLQCGEVGAAAGRGAGSHRHPGRHHGAGVQPGVLIHCQVKTSHLGRTYRNICLEITYV